MSSTTPISTFMDAVPAGLHVRDLELAVLEAVDAHGQESEEAKSAVLAFFEGLDGPSGEGILRGDPKVDADAYAKARARTVENFWAKWWPSFKTFRAQRWSEHDATRQARLSA